METQDEHTRSFHCCPLIPWLMRPMRKLDNAVLYASYSGFYTAFINKWQKRADILAEYDASEIKELTDDVANFASKLEEPQSFAQMGGFSFMETELYGAMVDKAVKMGKEKGVSFLRDKLSTKVCEVIRLCCVEQYARSFCLRCAHSLPLSLLSYPLRVSHTGLLGCAY